MDLSLVVLKKTIYKNNLDHYEFFSLELSSNNLTTTKRLKIENKIFKLKRVQSVYLITAKFVRALLTIECISNLKKNLDKKQKHLYLCYRASVFYCTTVTACIIQVV